MKCIKWRHRFGLVWLSSRPPCVCSSVEGARSLTAATEMCSCLASTDMPAPLKGRDVPRTRPEEVERPTGEQGAPPPRILLLPSPLLPKDYISSSRCVSTCPPAPTLWNGFAPIVNPSLALFKCEHESQILSVVYGMRTYVEKGKNEWSYCSSSGCWRWSWAGAKEYANRETKEDEACRLAKRLMNSQEGANTERGMYARRKGASSDPGTEVFGWTSECIKERVKESEKNKNEIKGKKTSEAVDTSA